MFVNKNSFKDLSDFEMKTIGGGGILFKLGQAAHKAWCSVRDAWMAQEPENIMGPTGNRYF
jgi:hypothetical protein